MQKNLKLILLSFTRQQSEADCGAACLATIFKYGGLQFSMPGRSGLPLSLRQLQDLSREAGLNSRAVRMDIEHLRRSNFPGILHIITDEQLPHFILHFAYDQALGLHLVGDPDGEVSYITDEELLHKWQSRAALCFEELPRLNSWRVRLYPWINLCRFDFVPGILWIAIPLLNAFGTLLGLGATLVIEKAVSPQFLDSEQTLMIMIFILLFSLSLAKCVINYIKERLIINFASKLDSLLYLEFVSSFRRSLFNPRLLSRKFMESIKDVQRIHQSASILIGGILCDSLMVCIMLTVLYFYFPLLIFPETGMIIIMIWLMDRQLPFMLVNYRSAQNRIFPAFKTDPADYSFNREELIRSGFDANSAFSRKSRRLSIKANRLNFYCDTISSVNFLLVLAYGIGELRQSVVSYQEFIFGIVLCYGIAAITTKICNQMFLVAYGTEILSRRPKKN